MSEKKESVLKRCEEGHVFDAANNERCPTCGSPVAGSRQREETPDMAPPPDASREPEAAPAQEAKAPVQEGAGTSAQSQAAEKQVAQNQDGVADVLSHLPPWLREPRTLAVIAGSLAVLFLIALFVGQDAPDTKPQVADQTVSDDDVVFDDARPIEEENRFNPSTADPFGVWEMFVPTPGAGPQRHVFEILPNGNYKIYAGPYSHAGHIVFTGRVYQLKSRTSIYEDGGAFSRPDPDTIVFEGRLGRSVWASVGQPGLYDVVDDGSGLPENVPDVLARMTKKMQTTWREDAIAVALEIERTRHEAYDVEVRFLSPTDRTGMIVTWNRFADSEFSVGGTSWFDQPLPTAFRDLKDAYAAMNNKAPIKRAMLGYFARRGGGETYDRSAPASWSIIPEAGRSGTVTATTN